MSAARRPIFGPRGNEATVATLSPTNNGASGAIGWRRRLGSGTSSPRRVANDDDDRVAVGHDSRSMIATTLAASKAEKNLIRILITVSSCRLTDYSTGRYAHCEGSYRYHQSCRNHGVTDKGPCLKYNKMLERRDILIFSHLTILRKFVEWLDGSAADWSSGWRLGHFAAPTQEPTACSNPSTSRTTI